jgi:protein Mpv17
VLWNPIFGIMFFSYVACLEWKGIDYVVEKTKNELMTQASDPPALGLGGLFGKGG